MITLAALTIGLLAVNLYLGMILFAQPRPVRKEPAYTRRNVYGWDDQGRAWTAAQLCPGVVRLDCDGRTWVDQCGPVTIGRMTRTYGIRWDV